VLAAVEHPRRAPPRLLSLALYLLDHVVDDLTVFVLRAEHDNLRVSLDLYVVSGRPVEEVIRLHRLLHADRIGGGELTTYDEAQ